MIFPEDAPGAACATRPEFRCGGDLGNIARPDPDTAGREWAAYLFDRTTTRRASGSERWLHRDGCGRWFNVDRDTVDPRDPRGLRLTDPKRRWA
jgi:sarcosine oxidase subunit delta